MKLSSLLISLFILACQSGDPEATQQAEQQSSPTTYQEVANTVEAPKENATEPAPVPTASTPVKEQKQTAQKSTTTPDVKTAPEAPAPTAEVTQTVEETPPPPPAVQPEIQALSHTDWNILLQKHVSTSGKVNYAGFKADKRALEHYLALLADNPPQSDWSRKEKMAYWINTYNAFTIQLITENYPVSSIMKLDGGKTWDVKRIVLGGKSYSLNQIENEILRPQFKDARIHFAVNCAAKSCPPLWNQAFTAENLNSALDRRARQFINNSQYNKLSGSSISVSKIFEWYAGDFGDLIAYLNTYASTPVDSNARIQYMEYNWDLNN
ncbi:MAG: DUF547 domain-containing protein [Saprospiraceae bacterium]